MVINRCSRPFHWDITLWIQEQIQLASALRHACANRQLSGLVRMGACFAGKGWGRAAKQAGCGQPCQSVTFGA